MPAFSSEQTAEQIELPQPAEPKAEPGYRITISSLFHLIRSTSLESILFLAGLGVYAVTRIYALDRFPIYFFGDEAVQVLLAENLLTQGFIGPDGTPFPVYIEAAALRWTPLLSMYFHALTLSLFGKSILVTRLTSAAVSILGAVSVALILKDIFKAKFWWAGVLLVAVMPAWFLHSRTAFETVMTTAFYGCFLLFYLLYRYRSPRFLYPAILFAAMTFYTYSNAQLIVAAAGLMLFLSDIRYHVRHRDVLLRGLFLGCILAIPLMVFRLNHPGAIQDHLHMVNSYWMRPIPLIAKINLYLNRYAYGLSPLYWFFPNEHDLPRHRLLGIAHISTWLLPFVLLGVLICLRNIRYSAHRAVLIVTLATPVGASLVDAGIARLLPFIIPAAILAGIGLDRILVWGLERSKRRIPIWLPAVALFLVLSLANLLQLDNALSNGPLWFHDYGLYGMQYGAKQIFADAIPKYLAGDEQVQVLVSSTWANGTDNFLRFFLSTEERQRTRMDGIASYLFRKLPLSDDMLFIMTASEYQEMLASPKFTRVQVEEIIPYPDGSPGFYVARMAYADSADAIFAAEMDARRQLVEGQVSIGGQTVRIRHSQIDMGSPWLMFDHDDFTLMRGLEANPFVIELYFPEPTTFTGLKAVFGSVNYDLKVRLHTSTVDEGIEYQANYRKATGEPGAEVSFGGGLQDISWLRLEIYNPESGEFANIHIRELELIP